MKVRELIHELSQLDEELEAVLAKDGEGNGFSPLSEVAVGVYTPASTWAGEWRDGSSTRADPANNSVCLWPVN